MKQRFRIYYTPEQKTISLNKEGVTMKQRSRIYYTPEQKAIIWDRYKQGDSLHE